MKTDLTEYPCSFFSSQLLWLDDGLPKQIARHTSQRSLRFPSQLSLKSLQE